MRRNVSVPIFAIIVAVSFSTLSFGQEKQAAQKPEATPESVAVAPAVPPAAASPSSAKPVPTEWLYGEVNSVDISGKTLTLTYLDYDTDIEKQAAVSVDAKTIFENVKSLEEIKPQDMVSIDYIIGADSKNVAVTISVEKPESIDDLNAEGSAPEEPKQQIKPAVEETPVPPAANPVSETGKSQ